MDRTSPWLPDRLRGLRGAEAHLLASPSPGLGPLGLRGRACPVTGPSPSQGLWGTFLLRWEARAPWVVWGVGEPAAVPELKRTEGHANTQPGPTHACSY